MLKKLDRASDVQSYTRLVGSKTLAEDAYHRLRQDILSGELKPGEKLRLEALSRRYEVGMGPLREALSRLTGSNLVITEGQRGFWVAPLSIKEFEDIARVRFMVESEALYASTGLGDETWAQHVQETYEILSEVELRLSSASPSCVDEFEVANRNFHAVIVEACDSPWLIRLVSMFYQLSERYRRFALTRTNQIRSVHDEHEALVGAVLARNGLKACRLLDIHLQGTADVVRAGLISYDPSRDV